MDWLKKHWVYVIVGAFFLLLLFTFSSLYESATRLIGFVPEEIRNEPPPPKRSQETSPPLRYRPARSQISGDSLARMDRLRDLLRKQSTELERVTKERNGLRDRLAAESRKKQAQAASKPTPKSPPPATQPDPMLDIARLEAERMRDLSEIERLLEELQSADLEARRASERMQALQSVASEAIFRAGEAAVPSLVESLRDQRADVRLWAATLLGAIGAEARDAIPALNEGLAERDANVRAAIRRAISLIEGG